MGRALTKTRSGRCTVCQQTVTFFRWFKTQAGEKSICHSCGASRAQQKAIAAKKANAEAKNIDHDQELDSLLELFTGGKGSNDRMGRAEVPARTDTPTTSQQAGSELGFPAEPHNLRVILEVGSKLAFLMAADV